jgi:3-hydroxybutyryl-CoA dehydratase
MTTAFTVGQRAFMKKRFNEEDVKLFANISGDINPIHLDENFAKRTRFKRRIVHGLLVASLISSVLGTKLPGAGTIYLRQELRFLAPVYIGEGVTAEVVVESFDPATKRMKLLTRCFNSSDKIVVDGSADVLVP